MANTVSTPAASPRWVNVVLGVWLFISAFLWPHSQAQLTNTWLMGVLCVLFALAAAYVSPARFLNALLAIWLFISAFALPRISVGTVWNNAIVAVLIFIVAMIPTTGAAASKYFHRPRPAP